MIDKLIEVLETLSPADLAWVFEHHTKLAEILRDHAIRIHFEKTSRS